MYCKSVKTTPRKTKAAVAAAIGSNVEGPRLGRPERADAREEQAEAQERPEQDDDAGQGGDAELGLDARLGHVPGEGDDAERKAGHAPKKKSPGPDRP